MQTRRSVREHDKVSPPDGPALRPGETGPEQVMAWRRDRIAHCIATLLRDPVVARSVARSVGEAARDRAANVIEVADFGTENRAYWLGNSAMRRTRL